MKDDAKSKEIRDKYVKHVARLLQLSGESEAQAATDAQTVLTMETELANAAMDIVAKTFKKVTIKTSTGTTTMYDCQGRAAAILAAAGKS